MENIAIIGLGCRFPQAETPEAFWHLVSNGRDAITEVPADRWNVDELYDSQPATPGKMNTRWGGFLSQVDGFDPFFFNISPREAERMDPQQRLFLEVAWEALENSGLATDKLAGTQTGVFAAMAVVNYDQLLYKNVTDLTQISAYDGIGTSFSLAASRLSYLLDLKGPSLAIETACSSSLVAVHLACQSLGTRESNLCIVGGVNLILTPELNIVFSQAQMMSPDGRCKTFDASANGYVRGEGCGVVILKRLSDALKDKDNILAVIRGSAVNQDGLSSGITAPNGPSQQAVIHQALEKAGVKPAQISYVEAHGTGTSLGDPIEVNSLKKVLMEDRDVNKPCWIGSVKTNIGHLEAAAGIASLIKVILSLQHQEIPPHLHLKQLNPYIKIKNTPIQIPTELQPWQAVEEKRLAGVSSFGFGGTNAHVVLEEAPIQQSEVKVHLCERSQHILTLSAKCEKALLQLAQCYHEFLGDNSTASIADICFTANTGRSHFKHRLAVVGQSTEQLRQQLKAFETVGETTGLVSGQVTRRKRPKVAFLFTGQGSQYVNMGRELYETQPVFRKTLEQCDAILRLYLKKPLLSVLYPEPGETSPIDETAYTQPALFAIEYAVAQLWQSWGIQPDVVMGHSVGEYVAACVAGVFTLEDGLELIAYRGKLMQALPANGKMVSVLADEATVREAIEPYKGSIEIAAFNGPKSLVISGQQDRIDVVRANLDDKGIKTKELNVSHAFHSPLMEPMLAEYESIAAQVSYKAPKIPLISNLTGKRADESITTAKYWVRHVREPVKFAQSMETLHQQGDFVFVEMGAKPILLGMGRQCLPADAGIWLPTLRPGVEDWQQILRSLGQMYVQGVEVNWSGFDREYARRKVALPTYPFQRQRYWIEAAEHGQQKTEALKQKNESNLIYNLLSKGETKLVGNELKKLGELSEDEIKLLPKILELLVNQNRQQLRIVSTASQNGASKINEKLSDLNSLLQKSNSDEILKAEPETRKHLLRSYISQLLAKVAGISPSALDWQKRLSELGLDSLMATEIRNLIESNLKIVVPVEYFAELDVEQFLTQILFLIEQKFSQEHLQKQKTSTHLVEVPAHQTQQWFKFSARNSKARFRLFCFSYAGASASIFNSWSEKFPAEIEICPIQLPGRENRLKEPPFTRLKPLIQALAPLLKPYLDVPFAFFGHSMGALLSFELARELRRRNWSCPVHLFVSGSRAPQLPNPEPPIHRLPELKFKEKLKHLNGTPKEVLQNADLMQLFLPALRADFAILETYFYANEQPLDCPISAFGGLQDSKIGREEIAAWRQQTHRDFTLQMFSGDHFFLNIAGRALVQTISQKLLQLPEDPHEARGSSRKFAA